MDSKQLLDLSYLTVEEKNHLFSVISADEELRVRRLGLLKDIPVSKLSWSPGRGQPLTFQQLQLKLESDHIYGSELLRKSLMNAPQDGSSGLPGGVECAHMIEATVPEVVVSPELEEKYIKSNHENLKNQFGSSGTLYHQHDYIITGEVLVGVYYKSNQLHIHVDRARGLAAADSNGYSNPYIKTYLLPDKAKHTKQKTSVKKKTVNPVYSEMLKYEYLESELTSWTLWLSVWDWDQFGRNKFLGELYIPLSSLDLTDTADNWYQLQDKVTDENRASPGEMSTVLLEQHQSVKPHQPPLSISENAKGPQHSWPIRATIPAGDIAVATSISEEDIQVKPQRIPVFKQESATEPKGDYREPLEPPMQPKSFLAETDHQGLPQKQYSPLARLKQAENSSMSGSVSSFGSMASVYSEAGGEGDYVITGEVLVGVCYKNNQLHVHVDRARGLAAAKSNGFSNPYIKTYLLPDKAKHTKQKTSVKKKTMNPVYNETLTCTLSKSELSSRTLWLSVWDWDRFGRNQFLGEVRLSLSSLDLTVSSSQWYKLQDKDDAATGGMDAFYRGELKVGLKYLPSGGSKPIGTLVIDVKQAKELPAVGIEGTNSVVKLYLLPNRRSSGKRKTSVIKNNVNPVWEEKFTFEDVNLNELSFERVLEISLWNYDNSSHTFIGGLRLGPAPGSAAKYKDWMDTIGDEVTHWEDMLAYPGEWVEQWHILRTTLNPRNMDPLVLTPADSPISHTPIYAEESQEKLATPVPGLLSLKRAGSSTNFGSMTSIYSEAGGKGDYDITGEVLVGVYYKTNQLHIHVDRARGLAAADSNGYSDPYVKIYLLPDKAKHTKQKTSVKKKTVNPVYNEILKYKLSEEELNSRTLWLSVWDWDRFGRNQFLGEVRLPLSSLNLHDTTDQWFSLQDKDEESSRDEAYKGQLKLSLMYSPEGQAKKNKGQGTVHVAVQQAKDFQEPVDSFVKLYLLPDKSSSGKRKTKIIKSSLKPAWEERFTYEKIKLENLSSERVLEVTVWNFHKRSGNAFIGGLRLGPAPGSAAKHKDWMDSIGDEVTHWEDMLARPGEWVEQWHTLRTTMNPRDILF